MLTSSTAGDAELKLRLLDLARQPCTSHSGWCHNGQHSLWYSLRSEWWNFSRAARILPAAEATDLVCQINVGRR